MSDDSKDSRTIALSPVQAAARVGVGRTFIFKEIRAGRLVARKAGRRTLILANDVDRWIEALPTRIANAR